MDGIGRRALLAGRILSRPESWSYRTEEVVMTGASTSRPIVVGVDGTEESRSATEWALNEASRRGAPVELVHAYEYPPPLLPFYDAAEEVTEQHLREVARNAMARAVKEAGQRDHATRTTGEVREGSPIQVFLDAARTAAMVVVATRGTGPMGELVVGSTGTALASQAVCPVVVVPRSDTTGAETDSVVVGVDGSKNSQAAVELALEEASLRGSALRVVHAWRPAPPDLSAAQGAKWRRDRADEVEHRLLISEALAGAGERYPQVAVLEEVVRDHPLPALLAASQQAGLLVVGACGTGGYPGMALGSVAQAVLHHARQPVCVVPDRAG
jgi:nucleotide-binding universal stress UspA family protein